MPRFTRLTGSEKLRRTIWCEIFVVTEGYIPYLRKWIKLQDSPKAKIKADQSDQSDIQHLAELVTHKNSLNQTTQHNQLEGRISDSQVNSQTHDEEVPP